MAFMGASKQGGSWKVYAHMLATAYVFGVVALAGALVVGGRDYFDATWARVLVWLALASTAYLAADRTTWLPFLGKSAFSASLLRPSTPPGADVVVSVAAPGWAAYVAYWAASPGNFETPQQAYAENAGVAVPAGGRADLAIKRPGSYSVPWAGRLTTHVHYRFVDAGGMMSEVHTARVS